MPDKTLSERAAELADALGADIKSIQSQILASSGTSSAAVAFKYIGSTQPATTGWAVNDLWLDTSTEA